MRDINILRVIKRTGIIASTLLIIGYTIVKPTDANAATRGQSDSRTSSVNSFPDAIWYDDGSMSGTLYKNGGSYVSSGSYTEAHTKYVTAPTASVVKTDMAEWMGGGFVTRYTDPHTYALAYEYNQDGYSGTLWRKNIGTSDKHYVYPTSNRVVGNIYPYYRYTYHYEFQGDVTRPASDTRQYTQNYYGELTSNRDASISTNIPSTMLIGHQYTAYITATNTGNYTWSAGSGYKLGAVGDSDPFTYNRFDLPWDIPKGHSYTWTITFTAPWSLTDYISDWQMLQEGVTWFGGVGSQYVHLTEDIPPKLSFNPDGTGWGRDNMTVNLWAWDDESGLQYTNVWIQQNDGGWQWYGNNVTSIWLSGTGYYDIIYEAVDNRGNSSGQHSRRYHIDQKAPVSGWDPASYFNDSDNLYILQQGIYDEHVGINTAGTYAYVYPEGSSNKGAKVRLWKSASYDDYSANINVSDHSGQNMSRNWTIEVHAVDNLGNDGVIRYQNITRPPSNPIASNIEIIEYEYKNDSTKIKWVRAGDEFRVYQEGYIYYGYPTGSIIRITPGTDPNSGILLSTAMGQSGYSNWEGNNPNIWRSRNTYLSLWGDDAVGRAAGAHVLTANSNLNNGIYYVSGLTDMTRTGATTLESGWVRESYRLGIDGQAPTLSGNDYYDWSGSNITIQKSARDNESGLQYIDIFDNNWNLLDRQYGGSLSYVVSKDGVNTYYVKAVDNVGNDSYSTITTKVDKTLPTGSFSPNSVNWTRYNITTKFTPSDSLSGVRQWRYKKSSNNGASYGSWSAYIIGSASANITLDTEGNNRVIAEVTDNVGNVGTVTSGVYQIDKTKPIITGNDINGVYGWTNANVTINQSAQDSLSGVRYMSLLNEEGTDELAVGDDSLSYTVTTEGITSFYTEAGDVAGNSSILIFETRIDKTLPSGLFSPNSKAWGSGNITVNFNPSDDRSGVKRWRYRQSSDGVTYGAWSSYIVGDIDSNIVISSEGRNRIQAEVTDIAGNIRVLTSGEYQIDRVIPSGVFSPNSASWRNTNITVSFNPSDERSGVKQWRYRTSSNNGFNYGSWSSYIVGDTTSNIVISAEGNNRIQVEVIDNAGNSDILISGSYDIDKVLPTVAFSPNTSPWGNKDITVLMSPDDDRSGVKQWRYRLSIDSGSTWGAWSAYIAGNVSKSITISTEGYNKIQVETTDKASNISNIGSGIYHIDKTAPAGNVDFSYNDKTMALSIKFNNIVEKYSGVKTVYVQYKNNATGALVSTQNFTASGLNYVRSDNLYSIGNVNVYKIEVYALDVAGNTRLLATQVIDTFKIEATLTKILDPTDNSFKTGEMGQIDMKVYGAAEKVAITFDSRLTTNTDELKLNKTIIYNPIVIYDEPKYKFSVPMRAPIDTPAGSYVVKIEATRNSITKTVFCTVNITNKSILEELKTIIIYPGSSSLNRGW